MAARLVVPQLVTRGLALILALGLSACAWKSGPGIDNPRTEALRQQILVETLGQIGRPYRYGGGDGAGFDCSGLALHVYADVGIQLPRTAAQQMRVGREIRPSAARPGDLQFYRINSGYHVVVDIGEGRGVHAPAPGRAVEIANIESEWWRKRRLKTVRVLP